MIMNSFKTGQEFALNPFSIPIKWVLENYSDAWVTANIGKYFFNSLVVGMGAVIIAILTGAFASYFLSRFAFKGRKLLYGLFIIGLLVPIHATLVPLFILMQKFGLLNTYWALIFPYVAFNLQFTIFLLTFFIISFYNEFEDASFID